MNSFCNSAVFDDVVSSSNLAALDLLQGLKSALLFKIRYEFSRSLLAELIFTFLRFFGTVLDLSISGII